MREKMIALLRPEFAAMNISYAIGGQISFDAFPKGWDKTCTATTTQRNAAPQRLLARDHATH